jgi:hypothetical protein
MEWLQFLRIQRASKIAFVEHLTASANRAPAIHHELLQKLIDEHHRHILEIDELLVSGSARGNLTCSAD